MKTALEKQLIAFNKLSKALEAVRNTVPDLKTIKVRFYKRGQMSKQTSYTYFQQP